MKTNGFHASTLGDKGGNSLYRRIVTVSIIMTMLLAALPVASVLAAPARGQGTSQNKTEAEWANKRSQLAAEVWFFNNFQTKPGQSGFNGNQGQYLDKWRAALAAAQALVVNHDGFDSNGRMTNENRANQAVQQLAQYLSLIRGLKDKIGEASRNNNNTANTNNSGNANGSAAPGIPVTGGSANNNQNNPNQNNNTQNNSPSKMWGTQFRDLQAAQTWFNNFRTKPGQNRNNEKISRYLDQYAFALRQAYAIIVNGPDANTQSNNGSNGQGNTRTWGTPQQQLAMYLHMMRGLREKIAEGGNDQNDNRR